MIDQKYPPTMGLAATPEELATYWELPLEVIYRILARTQIGSRSSEINSIKTP